MNTGAGNGRSDPPCALRHSPTDVAPIAVANAHARRPVVRAAPAAVHTASTRTRSRSRAIIGSARVALMNASAPPLPVASTAADRMRQRELGAERGRGPRIDERQRERMRLHRDLVDVVERGIGRPLFAHGQERLDRGMQVLAARVDLHVAVENRPFAGRDWPSAVPGGRCRRAPSNTRRRIRCRRRRCRTRPTRRSSFPPTRRAAGHTLRISAPDTRWSRGDALVSVAAPVSAERSRSASALRASATAAAAPTAQ